MPTMLVELEAQITSCRLCPRLVAWRERVAQTKRAAYADEEYWGRPVPGFGDSHARLIVVGLAPGAHGANRTGRMFTGDRSGDVLFAALHKAGFANQATSRCKEDGLVLDDCWITAPVRCVPPGNRPLPEERDRCASYLSAELAILPVKVAVALGAFAWDALLRHYGPPRPKPRFGHGATAQLAGVTLLGSYHVSQQNTFTGKLTPAMLETVFARAAMLLR
jgi:uracil-DNA glycosylase